MIELTPEALNARTDALLAKAKQTIEAIEKMKAGLAVYIAAMQEHYDVLEVMAEEALKPQERAPDGR